MFPFLLDRFQGLFKKMQVLNESYVFLLMTEIFVSQKHSNGFSLRNKIKNVVLRITNHVCEHGSNKAVNSFFRFNIASQ